MIELQNVSKELKFIILTIEDNESEFKDTLLDLNWEKFIDLAIHHRVYPLLYDRLKHNNNIPKNVLRKLSQLYKVNTFQMLQLSGEMVVINKLFSMSSIKCLFLKGPILASLLYEDISLRTSCDLDVLVPLEKLEEIHRLLSDEGYVEDEYIQSVLGDWKWRHHHRTYFHPLKKIKLEIHWRLNPGPCYEPKFKELWERRKQSKLMEDPIFHLGTEDLFYFLITHGARHGWSRLRWLVDIHQITKMEISWDKLTQLLKRNHSLQLGGQAIILASSLFKTNIDNEIRHIVSGNLPIKLAKSAVFYFEREINLHSDSLPGMIASYHKSYLFSLMSFSQRILYVLSFLHPYPEDASILPLPKRLHVLYFPLRPILWAWRKSRKLGVLGGVK